MSTSTVAKSRVLASRIPAAVLLLFLVLSPLAMSFVPSEAIYRDGVWAGTYVHDSSYAVRSTFIALGLLGSVSALVAACIALRIHRSYPVVITMGSVLSACMALGWCLYPYWVNGVYQAYSGAAPLRDLDPKALPPMIWVGELWRVPTLILWPLGVVVQVGALMSGAWISRAAWYRTPWFWLVCATAFIHLLSVFQLSPRYFEWLLD